MDVVHGDNTNNAFNLPFCKKKSLGTDMLSHKHLRFASRM